MRTDIIWPVVWGTCFIGGVILGSTGPVNVLAFGSSSPKLRGSQLGANEQVPDNLVVPENVVEQRQRQLQLQQGDALLSEARNVAAADITEPATATTTTTTRTLGSSEFDAGFGRPSTVAKRVYALNGGLWGPNEEEEKEIALELARLREEAFEAPATSSSGPDEESLESSLTATPSSEGDYYYSFSFSYDFEAGETSYSYDYEFPLFH